MTITEPEWTAGDEGDARMPAYAWVRQLSLWLLSLGLITAISSGGTAGYLIGQEADGRGAKIVAGVAAGILVAALAITPFLIVVAVLVLLRSMTRQLEWMVQRLYEQDEAA